MLKKIIEFLFKPNTCEYESNWSSQCYNRMWYILVIICNPLMIAIVAILRVIIKNNLFSIIAAVMGFMILIVNLTQLAIAGKIYSKHCEKLYKKLTGCK
jgi:hypothetical protein